MKVTAAITEENTFTDAITPSYNHGLSPFGYLTLSISGDFSATVSLQAAFDSGEDWLDTGDIYTTTVFDSIVCYEPGVSFRVGIKTGDYVSGTVNVRLSK